MADPADDIMDATFCALCDCGYADLTMRDIAERADRSKASLHYHYDSKHDLLCAFLEYLYEDFVERVEDAGADAEGPDERLRAFLADVVRPPDEDATREFRTALLEIEAQAPYDEDFRERLAAFDEYVEATVVDLVEAGVEAGTYREDVDPADVAGVVLTMVQGSQSRHVVAGEDPDRARAILETVLDRLLLPRAEVST